MITLQKVGDTIKFTFSGNPLYLNDGVIEAPLNSLTLVTDTSGIATFKKSATNDIFVCASYDELGMTKAELETWFKNNAVGGGGGIPSGDVQTMIDQSISGFADNASYDSVSQEIKFYNGNTEVYSVDASDFVIDGMIDDVRIETISGVTYLVIDFNTASGKEDIQIPLTDIFDPSNYYTKTEVDQALSGKADSSSVYSKSEVDNAISAATDDMATQTWVGQQGYQTSGDVQNAISGKADTTAVTASIEAATSGKVDSNSVVTAVTSGSTDSEIPTAKAVYDATQGGGGKAISAGTNISVTTGETADTVSCTLNAKNSSNSVGSIIIHGGSYAPYINGANFSVAEGGGGGIDNFSHNSHKEGLNCTIGSDAIASHVEGYYCEVTRNSKYCHAEGYYTKTNNESEHASGRYNNSIRASRTFGDSGNTLFSVGNGTSNNARHNAFEIRQNGDIYISSGGTDIKLQDNLGSSIEVSSAITSGDTNPVQGGTLFDELRLPVESESGLTLEWELYDGGGTTNYPSGQCSKIIFENIAISGGTEGDDWYESTNGFNFNDSGGFDIGHIEISINDGVVTVTQSQNVTYSISGNNVTVEYPSIAENVDHIYASYDNYWTTTAYVNATVFTPLIDQVSANTTAIASLEDNVNENEQVTARAIIDVNDKFGGLKLQKITQSAYDALSGNTDSNTLYVIVN